VKTTLLLSGGMDSLSVAWWKRPTSAITIDYGQLAASAEIEASVRICEELEIAHYVLTVDCRALGSGDMAGRAPDAFAPESDWWPYRNQLLLTLAAMNAVSRGVSCLLIGAVRSDSTHRDGTEEFVRAISRTLQIQEGGITVEAPAIGMTTVQLVRAASVPLPFLAWAHSCHRSHVACGACRGCNKYFEVLRELDDGLD
jgi:7-cyano-7-deazaguanine synthase